MEQAAPSISQAVIVTHDHAALLEFGKVLHAESFEKFRSRFLVEAHDSGTHDLQIAEGEFRTDFAAPAGRTEAHLGTFLRGQGDLLHLFDQTHIRCGVEFRGLDLLPNLRNVFHRGSCV